MSSIFLSYNSADKAFARRLADRLTKCGIFVWLDERQMVIGDSIIERIANAIERVDFLGVVLSSNSVNSPWVQKELELAMTAEIEGKKIKVLPILLEECSIPPYLKNKLYADFRRKHHFEKEFERLLQALKIDRDYEEELKHMGITVEWTNEGPRVYGNGVVISPLEWTALFNRFLEIYDKESIKKNDPNPLIVFAVIKACEQTYNATIYEEDLARLKSEIGQKADLFFKHVLALWDGSLKNRKVLD